MRLGERDRKFSGDLGESWMEYGVDHPQLSRDYSLTPSQKLQYLHNLLRRDAKRFYLDKIDRCTTSFQQGIEMLEWEYNSLVRQNRVKNYLNSLRVTNFVSQGIGMYTSLL